MMRVLLLIESRAGATKPYSKLGSTSPTPKGALHWREPCKELLGSKPGTGAVLGPAATARPAFERVVPVADLAQAEGVAIEMRHGRCFFLSSRALYLSPSLGGVSAHAPKKERH